MSAPLVVNLRDGSVWTRRGALRNGEALYAPADVFSCPESVMATEAELAEHGIAGVAYALPMPVAEPATEGLSAERLAKIRRDYADFSSDGTVRVLLAEVDRLTAERDAFCDRVDTLTSVATGNKRHVVAVTEECQRLAAEVMALREERHSTNEALDDAVQELRGHQPGAEVFVPQTERSRWVAIADALNAAHDAGMPVGVDLDGTLTDHRAWSVVWDRDAGRWTVAGYEDDADAETGGAS